jgi:Cu+-exporting ATPase
VQLALVRLDGVDKAKVSFSRKQAWVTYEPEKVTVQQMLDAVTRSGFGAEVVSVDDGQAQQGENISGEKVPKAEY